MTNVSGTRAALARGLQGSLGLRLPSRASWLPVGNVDGWVYESRHGDAAAALEERPFGVRSVKWVGDQSPRLTRKGTSRSVQAPAPRGQGKAPINVSFRASALPSSRRGGGWTASFHGRSSRRWVGRTEQVGA